MVSFELQIGGLVGLSVVAAPENFSRVFNTKLEYNITKK